MRCGRGCKGGYVLLSSTLILWQRWYLAGVLSARAWLRGKGEVYEVFGLRGLVF